MLSYQYKHVLNKIAKVSFPDKKILPFKVEIHPKEMKSRHGDYQRDKGLIRIFNLSQKVDYTISTALHELAHHCEFSFYGDTGHSKRFYEVFKALLETAELMGVIDYEEIRDQENARDIRALEKHCGPVSISEESNFVDTETVIKVMNSFLFRTQLKENGYFYDDIEKAWGKIIPNDTLQDEITFLSNYTTQENIITRPLFDLSFEAIYFIFILGGYQHRENLKSNGYFFKELQKKKGWAKKIVSTELAKEKEFLLSLSIEDFKVSSSLKGGK